MRVCTKNKRSRDWSRLRRITLLLVAVISGAVQAGFTVTAVQAKFADGQLALAGGFDLALTPRVEKALNNGIPLEVAIDIRLSRRRALLWNAVAKRWTLRRQLQYHALSGQYLVISEPALPQTRHGFDTLAEALARLGALDEVALTLPADLDRELDYRVEVRAALDIEALPALLRPRAYTSRAWQLDSGWSVWKVLR